MELNPARRGHSAFPAPSPQGRIAPTTEKAPDVRVVVTSLTPCQLPGNLKCFASVKFGKWVTLNGFRLIHEEGKSAWVGLPSNHRDDPDPKAPNGRKRVYFSLCVIPDNWKRVAEQAVLNAWYDFQETGVLPTNAIGGQGQ